MHDWTGIIEAVGDLLTFAAAVITLITVTSERNDE
jgi:hypothetical protein